MVLVRQDEFSRRLFEIKTQAHDENELEGLMALLCADVVRWTEEWVHIGKRAAFAEGCVLTWVERNWNELKQLIDAHDTFTDFARETTGEEYSTYRAKMAIYRVFIENEFNSQKVAEFGDRFIDVPIGKLQKCIARVKRDNLDDDQWSALFDPNVSDAMFSAILRREGGDIDVTGSASSESDDGYSTISPVGEIMFWTSGDNDNQIGQQIGYLNLGVTDLHCRQEIDRIIASSKIIVRR